MTWTYAFVKKTESCSPYGEDLWVSSWSLVCPIMIAIAGSLSAAYSREGFETQDLNHDWNGVYLL